MFRFSSGLSAHWCLSQVSLCITRARSQQLAHIELNILLYKKTNITVSWNSKSILKWIPVPANHRMNNWILQLDIITYVHGDNFLKNTTNIIMKNNMSIWYYHQTTGAGGLWGLEGIFQLFLWGAGEFLTRISAVSSVQPRLVGGMGSVTVTLHALL